MRFLILFLFIQISTLGYSQRWQLTESAGIIIPQSSSTFINNQSFTFLNAIGSTNLNPGLSVRIGLSYVPFNKYNKWKLGIRFGTQRLTFETDNFSIFSTNDDLFKNFISASDFKLSAHKYTIDLNLQRRLFDFLTLRLGGGVSFNKHKSLSGFLTSSFQLYKRDLSQFQIKTTSNLFASFGIEFNYPLKHNFNLTFITEATAHFDDDVIKDIINIKLMAFVLELGGEYKF